MIPSVIATPAAMGTTLTVIEDDGSTSPLRERTIAERVRAALNASGVDDEAMAEGLAAAVWSFAERTFGGADAKPPAGAEIEALVVRALEDAGHEAAARAYAGESRRRARLKAELLIVFDGEGAETAAARGDGDPSAGRAEPWDAEAWSRLVAKETELPASLADEVTAVVERRLAALGQRSAAERLVRELFQAELGERGIAGDMVDRGFTVARRDVSRAHSAYDAPPEAAVAGALFGRAALEELPKAVSGAHRAGRLHLFRLDRPTALERLAVSSRLLAGPPAAGGVVPARFLLRIRAALERLRPHVAGTIELPDVVGAAAAAVAPGEDPALVAADLETALVFENAFGAPVGAVIEAVVPLDGFSAGAAGVRERAVVAAFLGRMSTVPHLHTGLRIVFSTDGSIAADPAAASIWPAAATLLRARPDAALLARRAGADDPFCRDGDAIAARRLRLSPLRAAINLPLALLSAKGETLAAVLEQLATTGRLAVEAFHDALWRQRRGDPYGIHGVVVMFGGPASVVVEADQQEADLEVWGLPLALEMLIRRDVVGKAKASDAAARLLGFLDFLLSEDRNGLSLKVRLGGVRDREVRLRFHQAFERAAGEVGDQAAIAAIKRSRGGEGVLPIVPPLFNERNAALLNVPCAERFGPGLAVSETALPEGVRPELCAALIGRSRLGRLAIAPPGSGDALFEVQEELFR